MSEEVSAKRITMYKAFLEMQKELPVIPKTANGYKFDYAPYEEIWKRIKDIVNGHGFIINHVPQETKLTTQVIHAETGEMFTGTMTLPIPKTNQDAGSDQTYRKRYNLALLLGLAVEKELDADTRAKDTGVKQPITMPKAAEPGW